MAVGSIQVWAQWDDLRVPDSGRITLLSSDGIAPSEGDLDVIHVYVPPYMGGIEPVKLAARMPRLALLQLLTAGYETALPFVRPGVALANAAGVHDDSTAELAVGLAIAGRRQFRTFIENQLQQQWHHLRTASLADSRVAVIGFGPIGRRITAILESLATEPLAFSRSGSHGSRRMAEFLAEAGTFDVVILAVKLTPETRALVDGAFLARLKPGCLLVNVSRGAVIDTPSLLAVLASGKISAALDVTDPEPLPAGHPLWTADNCLITPHVGGDTTAFEPRARRFIERQLERLATGCAPTCVVGGEWRHPLLSSAPS
jgi:phosphoglycerate dehydrogenase-like enzyme